jgi:hypothetical protein
MNNTHFAIFNEDNALIAIVDNSAKLSSVRQAIEDETGDAVDRFVDFPTHHALSQSFKGVDFKVDIDGLIMKYRLIPTWLY